MKGIIVKILKDLFFVHTNSGLITCKARGVFRERKINPIVGDRVEIRINEDGSGYIENVFDRTNSLIRPEVANIDLLLNIHSIKEPNINTYMLDKALVMAEFYNIESIIIFSKNDLIDDHEFNHYKDIYNKAGYPVYKTSINGDDDLKEIENIILNKTSAVSGPSGSGKSTFLNRLNNDLNIETSAISHKSKRGKHTTRHIEIMPIANNTFILDTPGFSTINLDFIEDEGDLDKYFPEFRELKGNCKYNNCMHINEPKCNIKNELGSAISESRYNNYLLFFEEIKKFRRY